MGGGIASSIARALGGGRRADADALAVHALVIALVFGLAFTLGVLGGGRWLYGAMGGSGPALSAALVYSDWIFAGAVLVWLFNSLAAVIRGTGNMALPALVTCVGRRVPDPAVGRAHLRLGTVPGPRHRGRCAGVSLLLRHRRCRVGGVPVVRERRCAAIAGRRGLSLAALPRNPARRRWSPRS